MVLSLPIMMIAIQACEKRARESRERVPSAAVERAEQCQRELDQLQKVLGAISSTTTELRAELERDRSAVAAGATCAEWDCSPRCCKKILNITVCEPTCKLLCEQHNLMCHPSVCQAIRTAEPLYETFKSGWQEAHDRGAFCDLAGCLLIADRGSTAGTFLCDVLGGGIFCTIGGKVVREESKCICSELDYERSCGGGAGLAPMPESRTCCAKDAQGKCLVSKSQHGMCP